MHVYSLLGRESLYTVDGFMARAPEQVGRQGEHMPSVLHFFTGVLCELLFHWGVSPGLYWTGGRDPILRWIACLLSPEKQRIVQSPWSSREHRTGWEHSICTTPAQSANTTHPHLDIPPSHLYSTIERRKADVEQSILDGLQLELAEMNTADASIYPSADLD